MQRTLRRAAAISLMVVIQLLPATAATAADPVTETFSYTGGEQQFVVPNGVTTIHVVLVGGRGGHFGICSPGGLCGGRGARVEGDLLVTPGNPLYIEVGGPGITAEQTPTDGGFNGGGRGGAFTLLNGWAGSGGGASDIRTIPRDQAGSPGSRLIVAAGGGGASLGGFGGDAGQAGGGAAASGGAGTSAAGGSGGGGTASGQSGSLGQGGAGADAPDAGGGGGGGGLYGGGGGGSLSGQNGGGGGGGSSFTGSALSPAVGIDDTGTTSVSITYVPILDEATVGADVDVRSSAACLELSTTHVSFGQLSLGDEDKAAGPEVMIKNCSGNTENVFASGTAATGTGASWSLVDSAETCADTLGLDRYRLLLSSIEFAAPIRLATDPKAVTTLPAGFVSTETARIFMACPGSSGGGQTMNMAINYLAVEQ